MSSWLEVMSTACLARQQEATPQAASLGKTVIIESSRCRLVIQCMLGSCDALDSIPSTNKRTNKYDSKHCFYWTCIAFTPSLSWSIINWGLTVYAATNHIPICIHYMYILYLIKICYEFLAFLSSSCRFCIVMYLWICFSFLSPIATIIQQ